MKPYGPDSPWRLDPEVTYLNHGSFGACPVPVLEAQRAMIDELEAEPIQFLWATFEERLDAARREVAVFLDADPEGLVFVPNATTGVSTVLRSLYFEAGDELLTTNHEYNAILNAQAEVARLSSARVVIARLPLEIESDAQALEPILAAVTPRTRIAVLSHVTSPTGTLQPIADIVRELDARGIDTLVASGRDPDHRRPPPRWLARRHAGEHELVVEGRRRIAGALGVAPLIPESMLGSMAMIRLPIPSMPDAEIDGLKASIVAADRIEVPIHGWPVPAARTSPDALPSAVVARISAQLYNEPADYDGLTDALARRLAT